MRTRLKSLATGVSRPGSAALVLSLCAVAIIPILLLVRVSGPDGEEGVGATIAVIVVIGLLALAVLALLNLIAGPDPDAGVIARNLSTDPLSEQLLHRWLVRSRWYRTIGGLSGVVIIMLSGFGPIQLELLLVLGTSGVLIGAILSEWHQTKPHRGARIASMEVRTVDHYLDRTNKRRFLVLGALLFAVLGLAVAIGSAASGVWAAVALTVLGLTRLFQRRVAARARPHLSPSLTRADDLARHLAISRNLGMPANIVATAMLSVGLGGLGPPVDADLSTGLGFAAFLIALWWWWKNRRMGLNLSTRPAADGPPLPTAATR